jgi:hypothetical protein
MAEVNVRSAQTAVLDGTPQRAVSLTKQAPDVFAVRQEVVGAAFAHNFVGPVSDKEFRCIVPVRNSAFPISDVNTVRKAVHHAFEEIGLFIRGQNRKKGNRRLHVFSPS